MSRIHYATALAETFSWYCALFLAMMLLLSCCESNDEGEEEMQQQISMMMLMNNNNNHHHQQKRPCDEIYVVKEGETLHTISEKCGDPYIVEENPHIHDPDDVFPGLVIKITPFSKNYRY
ncbi:hypothetical protein Leryth_002443 [Lithospermum erythrorhizon]|nr:hypothetical protein Leryth_002443 [Lithospermum erythrorhizon]